MRRTAFILASLLVSAFFLWLALRDVPIPDVIASLRQADLGWLLISMVFTLAGLWTRAVRWRGLLGFKMRSTRSFHILNITNLVNQLPLRAGEVARSLLATREGVPFVTAATSIVVERLLDTLLVVVLLSAGLSRAPSSSAFASQSAALFGAASLVGFAALVLLARYPGFARRLLAWFEQRLPVLQRLPLHHLLDNMIDGLRPLTAWRSASHAVGWTLISWAISMGTFYAYHRAMRIESVDLLLSVALSISLASFSIAIPVSVAAIGPFEAAVKAAGEAVVLPAMWESLKASYTALGFLTHGMNVLNYAIWGTAGMVAMGVSLSDMVRAKKRGEFRSKPQPNA